MLIGYVYFNNIMFEMWILNGWDIIITIQCHFSYTFFKRTLDQLEGKRTSPLPFPFSELY